MNLRKITKRIAIYLFALIWTLITIFPFIWMFYSSLKTDQEIFANVWALPRKIHFDNYLKAWHGGNIQISLGRFLVNSGIVVISSVLLILSVSTLAAYVATRCRIRGKNIFYTILGISIMIPPQIAAISLFAELRWLRIYDTYLALILPYTAFNAPLATLLLWSYFVKFPIEIEEAAKIDGCSSFKFFWSIFLPILRPAIAAIASVIFVFLWNEFLFALLFIQENGLRTVTLGVFLAFKGQYTQYWSLLFAGLNVAIVPVILFYLFFQKQIIAGLAEGYGK